jgi:hypothetical protein
LVPISKSDVTQKRLDGILTAIKNPGGPAFVVLNDDMSDRASPKDADAMNRLMWRWMEVLWPEKVWIFPQAFTLAYYFYLDVLGILTGVPHYDHGLSIQLKKVCGQVGWFSRTRYALRI